MGLSKMRGMHSVTSPMLRDTVIFGLILENSLPSSCPKREAVLAKLSIMLSMLFEFLPSPVLSCLNPIFDMLSENSLACCSNSLACCSASASTCLSLFLSPKKKYSPFGFFTYSRPLAKLPLTVKLLRLRFGALGSRQTRRTPSSMRQMDAFAPSTSSKRTCTSPSGDSSKCTSSHTIVISMRPISAGWKVKSVCSPASSSSAGTSVLFGASSASGASDFFGYWLMTSSMPFKLSTTAAIASSSLSPRDVMS